MLVNAHSFPQQWRNTHQYTVIYKLGVKDWVREGKLGKEYTDQYICSLSCNKGVTTINIQSDIQCGLRNRTSGVTVRVRNKVYNRLEHIHFKIYMLSRL